MFFHARLRQHPAFMEGVRAMLPQTPGTAAWGLMTGVAMVKAGMSPFEAVAMTLLVFAGSAQLAATPLIIAGAPMWVILATAFCVNLRFLVFSLHLRDYLMHLPLAQRLWHGYINTDVSYVLFIRKFPHASHNAEERLEHEAWFTGSSWTNWASWISASLIGIAMGNLIPAAWGLGFAGILCLLAVQCALMSTWLRVFSAMSAGVVAVLFYALPLKLNIMLAIVLAVMLTLMIENSRGSAQDAGGSD